MSIALKMQDKSSLEDIVCFAQNGDLESLEYIINRLEPIVQGLSKSYFLPRETREDLLQEGKIAIFKAIKAYRIDTNVPFIPFAKMVLARKLKDALKVRNRIKHKSLNYACSLDCPYEEDKNLYAKIPLDIKATNPETVVIGDMFIQSIIQDLMTELTALEKRVFTLYFLNEMKLSEVAKIIETNVKSVDNATRRIRKKALKYKRYA